MELTQQHFDEQIKKLISKQDLLASKQDLEKQTKELKAFAKEQTEELARITNHGFNDVLDRLDVRERMQKLEKDMAAMKTALHLS